MSSAEETKSSVTGADKHISQPKHNVEREISSRQEVRVKLFYSRNKTRNQNKGKRKVYCQLVHIPSSNSNSSHPKKSVRVAGVCV